MSYGSSCERTERENRRLKQELEDQRYERERQQERQEAEERQARERRKRDAEDALANPSSWPEAFRNALILHGREEAETKKAIAEFPEFANEPAFQSGLEMPDKIRAMERIYDEEMDAALQQIAALRKAARLKAADRVEAEIADMEQEADALRRDEPTYLTDW